MSTGSASTPTEAACLRRRRGDLLAVQLLAAAVVQRHHGTLRPDLDHAERLHALRRRQVHRMRHALERDLGADNGAGAEGQTG